MNEANGREVEYLSNPLKNFFLVRQMHEDWDPVKKFMQQPVGQEQMKSIEKLHQDLPSQDDLKEASQAIFLITDAYDLEPKDVASGLVHGVQYSGNLSAKDCFALGKFFFQSGVASEWLITARDLLMKHTPKYLKVMGVTSQHITLLLARSLIARGNVSSDREMLEKDSKPGETGTDFESLELEEHPCLLSGRSKPTRLHCRYNTTSSPFLKLAPFRMEELSLSPYIVLYHNVLSDGEIEKLQRMSEPFLERSKIFTHDGGSTQVSPTRTADGVWLPHMNTELEDRLILSRIALRIRDITGLKLGRGGLMQFVKYGFGGHIKPHHDYFDFKLPNLEPTGDRIATFLFYLNNVLHGGATAFTELNIAVQPQKGSALFWYNMDGQSFDFDDLTFHGACPLISGTKMVLTRWIYELDQMFLLPAVIPPRNRDYSKILPNSMWET
ncbi:prolyl 4-hydroxylase subunit alpha-2 isoform X2 [Drosophila ficusphila]|nr:prolyl 4-hydroxylase subunit alpha-2 isoform X2 [Drosophila ficusphila]